MDCESQSLLTFACTRFVIQIVLTETDQPELKSQKIRVGITINHTRSDVKPEIRDLCIL